MEKKERNQLAREESIRNKEKCHNLLLLSQKIRYVGMINNFGRTIAGQLRSGLIPLLNVEQAINEHFIEATRNQLRKTFDSILGTTLYTLTVNEKVLTLTFPLQTGGYYYITLDNNIGREELVKLIDLLIQKINNDSS
jgi:CRISPR/Cas system CSM-associated protein Csm2 small subunit